MSGPGSSVLTRARAKLGRIATRSRDRFGGMGLRAEHRRCGVPIPPGALIHTVANTENVPWFLNSGAIAARCLEETLLRNGVAIASLGRVLDFGCGVGRVMRHWANVRGPEFHGTDYNAELVTWCRKDLSFARFELNTLDQRLSYPDNDFDFTYALSVFTHLDEPLQTFWMNELRRVLKPGGLAFITIHGKYYLNQLNESERADFLAGRPVVRLSTREGSNDCASFHPESTVRDGLASAFEVLDFVPEGALGNPKQDAYLLRKPR